MSIVMFYTTIRTHNITIFNSFDSTNIKSYNNEYILVRR